MTSPMTAAARRVLSLPPRSGRRRPGDRGFRLVLAAALLVAGCGSLPADELSAGGSFVADGDSTVADGDSTVADGDGPVSDGDAPRSERNDVRDPVDTDTAPAPATDVAGATEDPGGWSVPDIPVRSAASLDELAAPDLPAPTRLRVDSVGIDAAITDVGIRPDGDLEVPSEEEIGWYRFGPQPGEPGSSVVAAHVDYNGRPGAFFPLRDTQVGDLVEVDRADGSTLVFEVTSVTRYDKDELPADLWRRDGDPQLVLITCGGPFDRRERSYQDNVVVIAVPVDGAALTG